MTGAVYDDGVTHLTVMNPADLLRHAAAELTKLAVEVEAGTMVICNCSDAPFLQRVEGELVVAINIHYKPVKPAGATVQ